MSSWYVRIRGRVLGPFVFAQLQDMREKGHLQAFYEVSTDRVTWQAAAGIEGLFPKAAIIHRIPDPAPAAFAPAPIAPLPRRRGSWLTVFMIAGVLGLIGVLMLLVVGIIWYRGGFKGAAMALGRPGAIDFDKGMDDRERDRTVAEVVGLVVAGADVTSPDGSISEEMIATGTCFAVNPEGYLLTNRHVVEEVTNLRRSPLRLEVEAKRHMELRPKVWVFFSPSEKTEKYEAEVVHESREFDLAVLRVPRKTRKFLALSTANPDDTPRGTPVMACGFPGVDREPVTRQEWIDQLAKSETKGSVERQFAKKAFGFSMRKGIVNVRSSAIRASKWPREAVCLQHDAHIFGGNSGGPLMSEDGTVIGINTLARIKEDAGIPFNYSITMPQLRPEIDKHVPGAVWR